MANQKRLDMILLTAIMDVIAVVTALALAFFVRFSLEVVPVKGGTPDFTNYYGALIVILPVYLWVLRAYGLYESNRYMRRVEEIFLVIKAVTVSIVILMALTFIYRGFSYSRAYLFFMWLFSILTIGSFRYFLIQWGYRRRLQKKDLIRTLLIGANRSARNIIQWAHHHPHLGHDVVGVVSRDPALVGKHLEGVSILGVSDQCENFLNHLKPDRVVLVDPTFQRDKIADLVATCEGQMIDFKVAADFYGLMTQSVDVEYVSSVPLLGFRNLPLDDPWNRFVKRVFDITASTILMALTFPIWLGVMVLIKLEDGGPVFYVQERMGRDENTFPCLKFRTMKSNAEGETGPVWAKVNDDRRTKIGNFLRRWNLDELPQLWNVFVGDMSLVGPRPERPHFIHQFRESIPRYMSRHKVKSGLTGWAQVNGYRGNTSIQERIKYDLYYMENWSLFFDLEILFMTLFAFKNAY